MHAFMCTCVHVCISSLYSHVTVHIFGMTLNTYHYHIVDMTHSHYSKWVYVCQKTTMSNSYLKCYCHVCIKNYMPPNATYMPLMQISSCTDMSQISQYICIVWTQSNQQCDQEHWYTFISHYWHMPATLCTYPTRLLLQYTDTGTDISQACIKQYEGNCDGRNVVIHTIQMWMIKDVTVLFGKLNSNVNSIHRPDMKTNNQFPSHWHFVSNNQRTAHIWASPGF